MPSRSKKRDRRQNLSSASSENDSVLSKRGKFAGNPVDVLTEESQTIPPDATSRNYESSDLRRKVVELEAVMLQTQKKVQEMSGEMFVLRCENDGLKNEIRHLTREKDQIREELHGAQMTMRRNEEHINNLEQYGRHWNLRVRGVKEDRKNEEASECLSKTMGFFQSRLGVHDLSSTSIEIAHRLGKYVPGQDRVVIVRFMRRCDRSYILSQRRRLRGTNCSITEDLTHRNQRLLVRVKEALGQRNAWSWEGKIFANLPNGKIEQIRENTPLRDLVDDASLALHRRRDEAMQTPSRQRYGQPAGHGTFRGKRTEKAAPRGTASPGHSGANGEVRHGSEGTRRWESRKLMLPYSSRGAAGGQEGTSPTRDGTQQSSSSPASRQDNAEGNTLDNATSTPGKGPASPFTCKNTPTSTQQCVPATEVDKNKETVEVDVHNSDSEAEGCTDE